MSASTAQGRLKDALRQRKQSVGSWLTFPAEAPAEIMVQAGFEWLVIDMEHAPLDVSDAARLIRVIDLAGAAPLCRLPANDPVTAQRVLDAGASGIIVPRVESAADARRAVDAAYYPSTGHRGVGLARAQAYGSGLKDYRVSMTETLVVIAMIESRKGVDEVASIAATPDLDGLFIGPYDLSASLGLIGELDHPQVRAAEKRIVDTARAAGLACGLHVVHPTATAIRAAIQDGYTFLALGVDMIFLNEAATAAVAWAQPHVPILKGVG